ncbi:MAG: hypothetical protein LIP28_04560 [Deltaproteobacteria bacterium]|nr:hypothetical protein [Deltaproteobacteria bacterium]
MDIALAVETILAGASYRGSVTDNTEDAWNKVVWLDDRRGKPTWAEVTAAAPDPLVEARARKIAAIDAETSAAILAGFDHPVHGQILHFSYDALDQQNFADSANAAALAKMGVPGVPESVTWNGWKIEKDEEGREVSRSLVRLTLAPDEFLALYMGGALAHKAAQMETGGARKAAAEAAPTVEALEAV